MFTVCFICFSGNKSRSKYECREVKRVSVTITVRQLHTQSLDEKATRCICIPANPTAEPFTSRRVWVTQVKVERRIFKLHAARQAAGFDVLDVRTCRPERVVFAP